MNSEKKGEERKNELSEQELDAVSGGQTANFFNASTMQYQPGMAMNASTMQYQPGAGPMQAQTLEQQIPGQPLPGANPVQPASAPKRPGGVHSL